MAQQEAKEIFLIDDEISHLELMCNALRKQGFRVLPASGYCSGIFAFRLYSARFDLLVTAVALPPEAGCELADTLQTLDPSLTVIFVSDPSEVAVCHLRENLRHAADDTRPAGRASTTLAPAATVAGDGIVLYEEIKNGTVQMRRYETRAS